LRLGIASIEYVLGDRRLSNADLHAEQPDWDMEAITSKTGVTQRFVSTQDSALELALAAARKVVEREGADTIDCVLAVTSTAKRAFPGVACHAQHALGLRTGTFAFDINLGCSGFVYAYVTLASLVQSGVVQRPLLLCADTYAGCIDPQDRAARPIFSDAGAAVLFGDSTMLTIVDRDFGTDGRGADHLCLPAQRTADGEKPALHMNGAQVLMFTMSRVPESVRAVLSRNNLETKDVDLFVFHQASKVVLDSLQQKLGLSEEQLYRNLEEFGNTVSCTIPICLKQLIETQQLKPGALVVLCGFGVGLSWGTCLVRVG
jgi:3-oxoacyl-[acyl-carrier-protein] synthase III